MISINNIVIHAQKVPLLIIVFITKLKYQDLRQQMFKHSIGVEESGVFLVVHQEEYIFKQQLYLLPPGVRLYNFVQRLSQL